jgi:hypothetical protein
LNIWSLLAEVVAEGRAVADMLAAAVVVVVV